MSSMTDRQSDQSRLFYRHPSPHRRGGDRSQATCRSLERHIPVLFVVVQCLCVASQRASRDRRTRAGRLSFESEHEPCHRAHPRDPCGRADRDLPPTNTMSSSPFPALRCGASSSGHTGSTCAPFRPARWILLSPWWNPAPRWWTCLTRFFRERRSCSIERAWSACIC